MKKTLMIGLILSTAGAANSFAYDTSHVNIISQKQTIPSGVIANFKTIDVKDPLDINLLKQHAQASHAEDSINTITVAHDSYGPSRDGKTYLQGWSLIHVANQSPAPRIYNINVKICAVMKDNSEASCASSDEALLVPAGNEAYLGKIPSMGITYQQAGAYRFYVSSTVKAEDAPTRYTSTSYADVKVK